VILQARLGFPTGRADIGLEPCEESVAFLKTLRKDFEKVRCLLQLVVDREKLKRDQVCLLFQILCAVHTINSKTDETTVTKLAIGIVRHES